LIAFTPLAPGQRLRRSPSPVPKEIYALSLRKRVSEAAVEASFERSVERVDGDTSGHVPKRQSEEEVVRAAADFETFYKTHTPPAELLV
jgi:hypothetical protein